MAHFHDFNPWASKCVYVTEDDARHLIGDEYVEQVFRQYGRIVDAYLLPQPNGRYCFGIRYGISDNAYISPPVSADAARLIHNKYMEAP